MQYHVALFTQEELANLAADYPAGKTFKIKTNGKRHGSYVLQYRTETITIVSVEKVIKKAYWGDVEMWVVFYETDFFDYLGVERTTREMIFDKFICLVNE